MGGLSAKQRVESLRGLSFLAIGLVMWGVLALSLWSSYQRSIEFASLHGKGMARVLDGHLDATLAKIDGVLSAAVHELAPERSGTSPAAAAINARLAAWLRQIPESQSLRVVNADGAVIFDASGDLPKGNIADRAYFRRNRDDPAAGMVISEPLFARFTKNWVFTVSRQLRTADGRFVGLVQAAVRSDFFSDFFQTLGLHEGSLVALVGSDYRLFARHPAVPERLGQVLPNSELAQRIRHGENEGMYLSQSLNDGVERLHYFAVARHQPFIYVVGLPKAEVLRSFYNELAISALLGLSLSLLLWGTYRRWRTTHEQALALAETMTRRSETHSRRAEALLAGLPSPAWLSSRQGVLLAANPAFVRVFCPEQGLRLGSPLAEVLPAELRGQVEQEIGRQQAAPGERRFMLAVEVAGARRDYQIAVLPVLAADEDAGELAFIASDLSEIMAAAQATETALAATQANLEAKQRFLSVISHELKTPINGIMGMAEVLRMSDLDPETKACIDDMHAAGGQLLTLTEQILAYVTLEKQGQYSERQFFSPAGLALQLQERFGALASRRGLNLNFVLESGLPRLLRGELAAMRHILESFLDNACKFTAKGGITVRMQALGSVGGGLVRLRLLVEDTGVGIPAHYFAGLFQPFSQADSSYTRAHGGIGIGLAICQKLARLMHGELGVASPPGQGAQFWLDCQCALVSPPPAVGGPLFACPAAARATCAAAAYIRLYREREPDAAWRMGTQLLRQARGLLRELETQGTSGAAASERLQAYADLLEQLQCTCQATAVRELATGVMLGGTLGDDALLRLSIALVEVEEFLLTVQTETYPLQLAESVR